MIEPGLGAGNTPRLIHRQHLGDVGVSLRLTGTNVNMN